MSTYGAILPGGTRLARLPAEPSAEAKRRLEIIRWCEGHGGRVRQPETPLAVVQRIQALREEYPGWGREKLRILVLREGISISAKGIDRVIARLQARGVVREPARQRKAARPHKKRPRRPHDLQADPTLLHPLSVSHVLTYHTL